MFCCYCAVADIAVAVAAVVVIHHATTIFSVELHIHTFGDISKSTYCMAVFFLLLPLERYKSTETFISTNFISNFIVTMWFHCFLNNFILTFISNVIPKFLWLLRWSLVTMLKIMNIS